MRLQVEPPGWLGLCPAVHRHGHEVWAVLVVAEDHAALLAGTATHRCEAHRAPSVRLRRPQAFSPPTEPVDRAVYEPSRDDDPAGRESWRSLRRFGHHSHD